MNLFVAGAEATEALAGAVQWLPTPDVSSSRRTTGSESGDAAATGADVRLGKDCAAASAAPAEADGPSANGHADAAAGVSPRVQQDAQTAQADATPSGNFETMTFHVGGAPVRRKIYTRHTFFLRNALRPITSGTHIFSVLCL